MATKVKVKSTKVLKREKVVPFDGEENFVVPKKGGFGQPDMEGYVMVNAAGSALAAPLDAPQTSSPSTDTPMSTTATQSTGIVGAAITPEAPAPTATPITFQQGTTGVGVQQPPPPPTAPTTQYAPSGTQPQLTPMEAPTTPTIPSFPSIVTMSCDELKGHIATLESTMATSKFTQPVADAYNAQLASAKSLYTTKCPITTTPTPPPPPAPIIGSIFGGGGGGGLGEPPAEEEAPVQEEKKSGSGGLLLILAIVAGVYFLVRKK